MEQLLRCLVVAVFGVREIGLGRHEVVGERLGTRSPVGVRLRRARHPNRAPAIDEQAEVPPRAAPATAPPQPSIYSSSASSPSSSSSASTAIASRYSLRTVRSDRRAAGSTRKNHHPLMAWPVNLRAASDGLPNAAPS